MFRTHAFAGDKTKKKMRVSLLFPALDSPSLTNPLGIVFIGTYLKKNGVDVRLMDLQFSKSFEDWKGHLEEYKPDIVGISVLTLIANFAYKAAQMAKEFNPDIKVVIGGPHACAMPEDMLKSKNVDIVVVGEGEKTMLELVRALETGKDLAAVKGIIYREKGKIKHTAPRPYIEDLDELGIPDRDLLPTYPKYLKFPTPFPYVMPHTYIIGSRGCFGNCSFCQPMLRKIFGPRVRYRSPKMIVDEMEHLVNKYNAKSIYFADDTFTANKQWVTEFCEELIRRGLQKRMVWLGQTRVNVLTKELAQLLKRSGCIFLAFGVESGNQRVLDEVYTKGITPDQTRKAFKICDEVGILTETALIVGCHDETRESVMDTIKLVEDVNPDIADIHYLTPTPGSRLFEIYSEKGYLEYKSTDDPDRYTPGLVKLKYLTKDELIQLRNELDRAWHRRKRIWKMKWIGVKHAWSVFRVTGSLYEGVYALLRHLMHSDWRAYQIARYIGDYQKRMRAIRHKQVSQQAMSEKYRWVKEGSDA